MSNIEKSINLLVTEGTIQPYTFILATANHNKLGQIINIEDDSVNVTQNSNQADEITFTTYKYYQNDNGESLIQPLWDEIESLKYMYCVELDEYFIINVELDDENNEVKISKKITATSQCEIELSQKMIYDLEVNNENDYMIADTKNMYYCTYFYKEDNTELSLLHRILSFAPAYSIGTIDKSLKNAFATDIRTFSVSSSSVYDFLTGDVANEFHCLFEFDSVNRVINVHDLYSTCKSCGYYGEFQAQCPNCNSIDIESYGTDTTILVSTTNLTDEVQFNTDSDNIKNCFKLTAGDDLMNTTIREINPTGSDYIYHITDDVRKDFSTTLQQKLAAYDSLYSNTVVNSPIGLNQNKKTSYNSLVSKYQNHYKEYYKNAFGEYVKTINIIDDSKKGTDVISQYYAESLEFSNFLQYAMLPSAVTSNVTADGEKQRLESAINNGKFNNVGIPSSTASQMILENAVKNYVKLYVRSGYMKIELITTSYNTSDLTWSGHVKITNYSDENDISTSKDFNVIFTKDYDVYLTQKAQKDIADVYKKDNTYFDVFSIDDDNQFKTALTLYNSESLSNIYKAYESALTVLQTSNNEGLNTIKNKYKNRLNSVISEINVRENECNITSDICSLLWDRLQDIHSILSIQNYLGADLYKEFTLYIREDEYSNTNFVSDSLTNPMAAEQARKFLETANKELIKASTPQHTITTSIKNLALIPEFNPLISNFKLNNWIRVECDDMIYRLRLIGYSINFGSLSDISVEFSDVTVAPGFISDMQSLLQQASSMASTYDYTAKQAEKGYQSNETVSNWVKDGLNSANILLKNNDNEEFTMDRSGITGRVYDDVTEQYSPKQTRFTHNILAFTKDNWQTTSTALGEHNYNYWNGKKFVTATDYGLTSQFVTAGYISGGQIIGSNIYSENWDGSNVGTYIGLKDNVLKLGDKLVFENNKLTFGEDVSLSWGQITEQPDIPTDTSQLNNGAGYINSFQATQITKDTVTAPFINALKIKAGSVDAENITGTTITGKTIVGANGQFTEGFEVNIKMTETGYFKIYATAESIYIAWDDLEDSELNSSINIEPGGISLWSKSITVNGIEIGQS